MKPNAFTWIIIAAILIFVGVMISRKNKAANGNNNMRLYCGGSDAYGHNIYTGGACQTSSTGSYSVSSGGNGIWAFGNNGCYCNTNAIYTNPVPTPNNFGPIPQSNLENIAAGNSNPTANTPIKASANVSASMNAINKK